MKLSSPFQFCKSLAEGGLYASPNNGVGSSCAKLPDNVASPSSVAKRSRLSRFMAILELSAGGLNTGFIRLRSWSSPLDCKVNGKFIREFPWMMGTWWDPCICGGWPDWSGGKEGGGNRGFWNTPFVFVCPEYFSAWDPGKKPVWGAKNAGSVYWALNMGVFQKVSSLLLYDK